MRAQRTTGTRRIDFASPPVSSRRRPGPIATGSSLAKARRSVLRPFAIDRPRGMGPGLRRDDIGLRSANPIVLRAIA
ncbi:hypothetical protein E4K65_43280 [Bradyrhizobium niftali]|uniref:Uncharacterized protein n=1 Tax=Bradyrhizobium niftali TaxID=2560055 RepID=A0A4Y9L679_9BRAD|nr:hypothetical protein E4K65_43280 [Bradyrhizobium niftali]